MGVLPATGNPPEHAQRRRCVAFPPLNQAAFRGGLTAAPAKAAYVVKGHNDVSVHFAAGDAVERGDAAGGRAFGAPHVRPAQCPSRGTIHDNLTTHHLSHPASGEMVLL